MFLIFDGSDMSYDIWMFWIFILSVVKFCCLLIIIVFIILLVLVLGEFSNFFRYFLVFFMNWLVIFFLVWRRVIYRWMLENKFLINRFINFCIVDIVIVLVNILCSS